MKKPILYCLIVLGVVSCKLDEEPVNPSIELSAPEGFKITYVGTVSFDGDWKQFQMVDENVGYVLGTTHTGRVDVYKTEDGGRSWKDLDVTNSHDLNMRGDAESIHFLDTETGIFSYKVGDKVNIIRTTTGGSNWRGFVFVEYEGSIKNIKADESGNLYGLLVDEFNDATILKSYDKGLSWKLLDTSQNFYFSPFVFSFQVLGNKLYVSGFGASVMELDTAGHFLREINTNYSTLRDLAILDENNFLANSIGISLSDDGGESWQEINDTYGKLIGFNSPNEVLMIFSKTASAVADDVFAVTTDGGNTWLESKEPFDKITFDFVNSQKMGDNHYLMLIGQEIYEIKEN